jgi:hypothetical protein
MIPLQFAARVEARRRARNVILAQLRDAGIKATSVRVSEVRERADAWLASHPELIAAAAEAVSKFTTSETKSKPRKSTTSTVQMLGAK